MQKRSILRHALAIAMLASTACAPQETQPTPAPPPSAASAPRGDVSDLTLPRKGEVFRIGDETWVVDAATVSLPSQGVQEDTQIIDVTIQARRAGADSPEYLGGGTEDAPTRDVDGGTPP